jgi:nicotinate-nucleotide adenylyltransferase
MIGILGGAFDPVHHGHLRPALEMQQALGLDAIRLIPTGQPPHREAARASAGDRVAMLEMAMDGMPGWDIDRRELERDGPSYMVDTLQSLRDELGTEPPLVLLLGLDAFAGLTDWHRWPRLFELAHIAVSHRPGAGLEQLAAHPPLARELSQRLVEAAGALETRSAGMVYLHPVTQLEISSTTIRDMVARGEDPRYLLDDGVRDYIHSHHLYRD